MLHTLNLPEQFRQVLSYAPVARSRHFSLHHAPSLRAESSPARRSKTEPTASQKGGDSVPLGAGSPMGGMFLDPSRPAAELSSAGIMIPLQSVDNPVDETVEKPVDGAQTSLLQAAPAFGFVIPKRLARRAVTRNLIRRQMRCSFTEHRHALKTGAWVLRLRAPFDLKFYPSAASEPLRQAVREELQRLMVHLSR